jgi:hypothetical protein
MVSGLMSLRMISLYTGDDYPFGQVKKNVCLLHVSYIRLLSPPVDLLLVSHHDDAVSQSSCLPCGNIAFGFGSG